MPLTGEAKKIYQREYMRKRRKLDPVRLMLDPPKTVIIDNKEYIEPETDADGNVIYEEG